MLNSADASIFAPCRLPIATAAANCCLGLMPLPGTACRCVISTSAPTSGVNHDLGAIADAVIGVNDNQAIVIGN